MINIGDKVGHLTIVSMSNKTDSRKRKFYECLCDCGNVITVRYDTLNQNNTERNCGCVSTNLLRKNSYKHGMSHSRIYGIWDSMVCRCSTKTSGSYKNYGGRGISVCEDWKNSFSNFYNWAVENGYKDNLTIDRIDVNGNYCPSNCRWISMKKQQNNKTNNRIISFNGEQHTMTEWGEITGIKEYNIYNRLQDGWSVEDALTKPVVKYRKRVWNKTAEGTYHHENGIED